MGKSRGSTTTTTAPDAQTSEYMRKIWGAAGAAVNAPAFGVDPMVTQAGQTYSQMAGAGGLGLRALSGDQSAYAQLANPYQNEVLDATARQFGDTRAATMNSVNDAATQAGAFGGSRHGVAEGVAMRGVAQDQDAQMAGLRMQGYNDTMGRASTLGGYGSIGAGGLSSLGQYSRDVAMSNDPSMRALQYYSQAFAGMPHGQVQTQTQDSGGNWATGLLGLGVTGLGLASGLGWKPFGK